MQKPTPRIEISIFNRYHIISNPGGLDLSRSGLDQDSPLRRQKRVSLDSRENLDSFKKLVSTRWTFSISILIGLDCRDHQG